MYIEKSFRVSRNNGFSCFRQGAFAHDNNGDKEKH
jgi:hypothetical protein